MKPTGISERKTIAGSSSSNNASRLRRRMDGWEKLWVTLASLPGGIADYSRSSGQLSLYLSFSMFHPP